MRARGFRVAKGPWAPHPGRTLRAVALLGSRGARDHLQGFDELRVRRNRAQYDGLEIEPPEVGELLTHARAILAAVEEDLAL